jgi:nucleotide-binding universal stress UspA family protein
LNYSGGYEVFKKILLPLDGSHSCEKAREVAALLSGKFGSKIFVMHVISHDFMHPELKASYELPPLVLEELDRTYKDSGKKIIRSAQEFFQEEGIGNVETILEKAVDPTESILGKAKELNPDLIIMGNISETEAYRYSLGPIAEKILMQAPCPVLIVKRKTGMDKLLVAFDSSAQSKTALKYAVELCKSFQSAKMTVLNVENGELHRLEPELTRKVGEQILSKATTSLEGVMCDTRLEFGKPANMILKIAKLDNYDLIVLGSRGMNGIQRFFLGSVSAEVSMHAQRSVLLVH